MSLEMTNTMPQISDTHPATGLPSAQRLSTDPFTTVGIETIADRADVKLKYSRTRCAHGYTREQTCLDCEQGYSTDGHQYANLRYPPAFAYFSDDGTTCTYIAATPTNIRKLIRAGYNYFTPMRGSTSQFWS